MRLALLFLVICATTVAQSQPVRLSGRVVDNAGAAIGGARIMLTMPGQGEVTAETVSDELVAPEIGTPFLRH